MTDDDVKACEAAGVGHFQWCREHKKCMEAGCPNTVDGKSQFVVFCPACSTPEKLKEREQAAQRKVEETRLADQEKRRLANLDARRAKISAVLNLIPSRYRGLRMDADEIKLRVKRQGAIAEALAALTAPMVTLVGGAGSGKTSLASAMLGTIVAADLEGDLLLHKISEGAEWITAPELARARPGQKLGDGEAPLVKAAIECDLLILDDVGMERQDIGGALFDVIYARHEREARTIVTTGLSYALLVEKYGDGVARRLTEKSSAVLIHCATKPTKSAKNDV